MFDASQLLAANIDTIKELWMDAVRKDQRIQSSADLPDTALGNSLPMLLDGMVKALAHSHDESYEIVVNASLEHGTHRAKEGYNSAEIAWEYKILRRTIFSVLEPELVHGSPEEIIRTLRMIDAVLDEAISQCYTSYVEERVKELEQVRSQLILTNKELTRLLRSSKDSLAYMAHELKTPLTSIIGYTDLFIRQHQKPIDTDPRLPSLRNIERVLQNGRLLLRLVNDGLEFCRYEAGNIKLNFASVDVKLLVKEIIEIIEPLAQAKNLQLKIDCDRAPAEVVTDSFRLQQILTNLLSNAVRYTDTGYVQLECLIQPDNKWSFVVTDTGIGIAAEDKSRIFEPFGLAFTNKNPENRGSTGLGLAIVARLVNLLQGEIKVDSEVGVGSTFTVTLPLKIQVDS